MTLRISGLFRDIFQTQIALFDMAVSRVAERDEDDEWNPLAMRTPTGSQPGARIRRRPGSYGAGAAEVVLETNWSSRSELGGGLPCSDDARLRSRRSGGRRAGRVCRSCGRDDALVHPQDDRERDLLDGDGVADFAGGFAAAAAVLGNNPALYHLDTSRTDEPVARTLAEEIARIVRGRLTNPRWIAGMLGHGHRGVAEMAQAVDALYAFAATAAIVPGHLFDAVHDALIADDGDHRCCDHRQRAGRCDHG